MGLGRGGEVIGRWEEGLKRHCLCCACRCRRSDAALLNKEAFRLAVAARESPAASCATRQTNIGARARHPDSNPPGTPHCVARSVGRPATGHRDSRHTTILEYTHAHTVSSRVASQRVEERFSLSLAIAPFPTFYFSPLLPRQTLYPRDFLILELFCDLLPGCANVLSSCCDILIATFLARRGAYRHRRRAPPSNAIASLRPRLAKV